MRPTLGSDGASLDASLTLSERQAAAVGAMTYRLRHGPPMNKSDREMARFLMVVVGLAGVAVNPNGGGA